MLGLNYACRQYKATREFCDTHLPHSNPSLSGWYPRTILTQALPATRFFAYTDRTKMATTWYSATAPPQIHDKLCYLNTFPDELKYDLRILLPTRGSWHL